MNRTDKKSTSLEKFKPKKFIKELSPNPKSFTVSTKTNPKSKALSDNIDPKLIITQNFIHSQNINSSQKSNTQKNPISEAQAPDSKTKINHKTLKNDPQANLSQNLISKTKFNNKTSNPAIKMSPNTNPNPIFSPKPSTSPEILFKKTSSVKNLDNNNISSPIKKKNRPSIKKNDEILHKKLETPSFKKNETPSLKKIDTPPQKIIINEKPQKRTNNEKLEKEVETFINGILTIYEKYSRDTKNSYNSQKNKSNDMEKELENIKNNEKDTFLKRFFEKATNEKALEIIAEIKMIFENFMKKMKKTSFSKIFEKYRDLLLREIELIYKKQEVVSHRVRTTRSQENHKPLISLRENDKKPYYIKEL